MSIKSIRQNVESEEEFDRIYATAPSVFYDGKKIGIKTTNFEYPDKPITDVDEMNAVPDGILSLIGVTELLSASHNFRMMTEIVGRCVLATYDDESIQSMVNAMDAVIAAGREVEIERIRVEIARREGKEMH